MIASRIQGSPSALSLSSACSDVWTTPAHSIPTERAKLRGGSAANAWASLSPVILFLLASMPCPHFNLSQYPALPHLLSLTMAKQSAATAQLPSATHIQNRDLLLRLSFMHQAASYLHLAQAAGAPVSATAAVASEEEGRMAQGKMKAQVEVKAKVKEKGKGKPGSLDRLARTLGRGIKDIGLHNKAKLCVLQSLVCHFSSLLILLSNPPGTSPSSVRSAKAVAPSSSRGQRRASGSDVCFDASLSDMVSTAYHERGPSPRSHTASRTHAHRVTQTCLACSTTRSIPVPPSGAPPTPSPPTTSEGEFPSASSASSTPAPTSPTTTMTTTTTMAATTKQQRKRLRQRRPLPLSEREGVGHARFESDSAGRENGSAVELI